MRSDGTIAGAPREYEEPLWDEGRIPFRLRIGVTGHRNLDDREGLSVLVRERLNQLRGVFAPTETTRVNFAILSALAEGADRLVAGEALECLADSGVELQAVLPLKPNEYAKDFQSQESLQAFEHLLSRAAIRTEMPRARNREEAYELAGRYVVDHSDVMIALWDGRKPAGQGGTAEIVAYARRQEVPVLVVPTGRAGRAEDVGADVAQSHASVLRFDAARAVYERLDEFNQGSLQDRRLRSDVQREADRLGDLVEGSPIHWQYVRVAAWALPRMVRADALALRYQYWYYRLGAALFILSALAVTAIGAQSQAGWDPKVALLEVGFMLLLLILFWVARRGGVHDRWLGYRSLAEAFRSSLFIAMTGAQGRPEDRALESWGVVEEPWFQRGFSEAWRERPEVMPERSSAPELRRFLIEGWIEDQIRYHRKAIERFQRGRVRLTRAVFALFGVTIIIGILHSFEAIQGDFWPKLFIFLAVALPGFGAALAGIRDQRQYRVHEERSNSTVSRLERLRRDLEAHTGLRSVQQLAAQTQSVIEAENLDWSGVTEFQELELVI